MIKLLSAPTIVDFCITERCNLQCRHCFVSYKKNNLKELSTKGLKYIIDRLYEAKVFKIIITGGEPLLREDFFELVKYAKRYPFYLGLNTNALLITDDISKMIYEIGFKLRISVSLDGSSKDTYEALRGPGTFIRAIKGLEGLLRYNRNIRTFCVVNKFNFKDLENIVELSRSLGAPYIEFNTLLRGDCSTFVERNIFLNPHEKIEAIEKIIELKERYGNYIRGSFVRMAKRVSRLRAIAEDELLKLRAGYLQNCPAGFWLGAIRADGKVAPCYTMLDYVIGDLMKDSLKRIWLDSPALAEFRRMHNVSLDEIETCKGCIYKGVCNGGCRAGAYYFSNMERLDTYDPEGCYLFLKDCKK